MRKTNNFFCTKCTREYIKPENPCRECGDYNTIIEKQSDNFAKSPQASARTIRRHAKESERAIAKRMIAADGWDENYRNIASSTGRVGFITNLRFDAVSMNYAIENKNRKLPTWMIVAWSLIQQRAHDLNKQALLHIEPSNMPKEVPLNGLKLKLDTMAIITQQRHEDLIRAEKALSYFLDNLPTIDNAQEIYLEAVKILHGNNNE